MITVTRWMDLVLWDGIMLGEIRQKRQKLHDFTLHEKSWKKKKKRTNKTKQNQTHSDRDTVRLGKIDEGD